MKTCNTDGCTRPRKGHGLCDMHYQRARKAGTLPARPSMEQRFWAKVQTGEACWPVAVRLHLTCVAVRHCVNPGHLEPVTQRINILRGVSPAATRAAQTHCKRGHEFSPENTRVRRDGWRNCRQCDIDRKQALRGGVRYPLLPEPRTA